MARQWKGKCALCANEISQAEDLALRDAALGIPRPAMCSKCEALEARGLKATPMSELTMNGEGPLRQSALGRFPLPAGQFELDDRQSGMKREWFAVQDKEIEELYQALLEENTPVIIAVAPTGSGKSTFLPYRLLMPDALPSNTFSRGRQMVITQPRRGATIEITGFVGGCLHGADVGVGHEIGYRVRGDHACDNRNRMVYVTDGTLINWIVRGELDRISLIILDEAHERSQNIDVILALLADRLPQFPHLKLLIVSATIDHEKFRDFFDQHLPGTLHCGIIQCSGSKPVGLDIHWRDPAQTPFDYKQGALRDLGKQVWINLADAMFELIKEMHFPSGNPQKKILRGDVLGFLHGAKPIQDACDRIAARLRSELPDVAIQTDVYPLYAAVPPKKREEAIGEKKDPRRLRVVIASNAAETSLTIDSLVHVVDSGFIKQTQWDPQLMEAPLLPIAHSQAGCRQRWGRVGRKSEGFAWTLYTKHQFYNVFRQDTVPEIQRAFLDGVLLQAKMAGADRLDKSNFPWLDAPDSQEIQRSLARLGKQGAIDKDGDLTASGIIAAKSGGADIQYSRFVADADRFGFGVEAATLLPFLNEGLSNLFPNSNDQNADETYLVQAAQDRLRNACQDDLELCLRVYQDWISVTELPENCGWHPPKLPKQLHAHLPNGFPTPTDLSAALKPIRSLTELQQFLNEHFNRNPRFQFWIENTKGALGNEIKATWSRRNGIDASVMTEIASKREETIRELGAKKKELEDREIDFAGLDRLRLVMARTLQDSLYVLPDDNETTTGSNQVYDQLYPEQNNSPKVEIGSDSCCRAITPKTILAPGKKRRGNQHQADSNDTILLASFVIAVPGNPIDQLVLLSDLAMANYFREAFPRPLVGSEEDLRHQHHQRLRKEFPPGTLVEGMVTGEIGEDFELKVLRKIGYGHKLPSRNVFSNSRKENTLDKKEMGFTFSKSRPSHNTVISRDQTEEETNTSAMAETIDEDPEYQPNQNQASIPQGTEASRSYTNEKFVARLQQFSTKDRPNRDSIIQAEVLRYTEIGTRPALLISAPPMAERFAAFQQRFGAGDRIEVRVIGQTPSFSAVQGLQVREESTNWETIIPSEELALLSQTALLHQIPIGTTIKVTIHSIDPKNEQVLLTNLPTLVDRMTGFEVEQSYQATVAFIEYGRNLIFVYVTFTTSDPKKGIILSAKSILHRDVYDVDGRVSLPFKIGQTLDVKVRAQEKVRGLRSSIKPDQKEMSTLKAQGITADGNYFRMSRKMDLTLLEALEDRLNLASSRRLVRSLFFSTNEIQVDIQADDLGKIFHKGSRVKGYVIFAGREGIKLRLQLGVMGHIPIDEITWWKERPRARRFAKPGETHEAKIIGINYDTKTVLLSFRQMVQNPWNGLVDETYNSKSIYEGTVQNTIEKGAFVELEPGLEGFVPCVNMRDFHGDYVYYAEEVVSNGDRVKVKIDTIAHSEKKISLILVEIVSSSDSKDQTSPTNEDYQPDNSSSSPTSPWPWTAGEAAIKKQTEQPLRKAAHRETVHSLSKRPFPQSWNLKNLPYWQKLRSILTTTL